MIATPTPKKRRWENRESETNPGNERLNASANNRKNLRCSRCVKDGYRSACQQMLGLGLYKRLHQGCRLRKRFQSMKFAHQYKRTGVHESTSQTAPDTPTKTFPKWPDQGTNGRTRVEARGADRAPKVRQSAREHTFVRRKKNDK